MQRKLIGKGSTFGTINRMTRLHRRKRTPQQRDKWLASWAIKRSRGKTWYVLEIITFFSFASLSAQWFVTLVGLENYFGDGPFGVGRCILMGVFVGLIGFKSNEQMYQEYLAYLRQQHRTT